MNIRLERIRVLGGYWNGGKIPSSHFSWFDVPSHSCDVVSVRSVCDHYKG